MAASAAREQGFSLRSPAREVMPPVRGLRKWSGPKEPQRAALLRIATVIEEEILAKSFIVTGLAPGAHEFVIVPHNSRGSGPASAPASVTI